MPDTIGDRLRKARKRAGLSQRDLARESGVSYSLITKIEQNERQDARLETLHRIARVLDTTTTALITSDGDRQGIPPEPSAQWDEVRDAVSATTLSDIAESPTVQGVQAAVAAARRGYQSGEFAGLAALLPPLIRDAHVLADLTPEGVALRADVLTMTARLMTQSATPPIWLTASPWSTSAAGSCSGADK
ncbi:helix-turn-helix transcriptional regulator [Streptomyces sp. MP131-18]|uniref:helix-turn-helix domain-containing protein n=1 Tax=Streptomyces sp. MP131-18 TaxID=1857892 RepID=UPI0009D369AB|nr:helix-turn-helix transcriptional regulator [Streptomyces sp. MP131-18]ONK14151.1 HTH-type transcriptional regulator SinR [Streptomyces sp. MP131-18]